MSHNGDKWLHKAGIKYDEKLAVIILLYNFHLGTFCQHFSYDGY